MPSNDKVPRSRPASRLKIAPTAGSRCSASTTAVTRASSGARKCTAPPATTISGVPSAIVRTNGFTSAGKLNPPVCVEKPWSDVTRMLVASSRP